MNPDVFDGIARRFAATSEHLGTRRALLRALGLGAGAVALWQEAVLADRSSSGIGYRVRLQTTDEPTLIDDLAFELEYDVDKIFAFVADEIRYEPYAGALRGPIGTIWAGAGNSVDKSQLLAALLEASLAHVTFVTGTADAPALREQYDLDQTRPGSATLGRVISAHLAAANPGLDPTAIATPQPPSERAAALRTELLAEAADRVGMLADRLTGTLRDAGASLVTGEIEVPAAETERHTWVRVAFGPDWVDLDPSLPSDRIAATTGDEMDAIPEDWFHTVTVRVSYDKATGNDIERVTSLEHTVRSQDLINGSFALVHVESENLTDMGFDLGAILEGRQGFHPTILAGTEFFFASEPMNFGGQGGVLDVFDEESALAEGEAIAEFVEVEIRSPGAEPLVSSRPIFDRAASQRALESIDLAGIEPVELTDIGAEKRQYLPLAPYRAFAAITGPVPPGYSLMKPAVESNFSAFSDAARGNQAVRQAIATAGGTSVAGGVVDRPNVVGYTYSPAPDEAGNLFGLEIAADLLTQSSRGTGREEETPYGILAGVTAQVAEETALDPRLFELVADIAAPAVPAVTGGVTVGRIFEAAIDQQIDWRVISSPDDLEALPALVEDGPRALIAAHLERGQVVVVPAETVEVDGETAFGWWIYDPVTGALFDQLADGRSAAFATLKEYALKLQIAVYAAAPFLTNGECIAALAAAANDLLTGDSWGAVANAVEKFGACA